MWYNDTKQLVADGKLVVIGLIQEQHAERARLYAQWKGLDWPILQDSMTTNALAVVPVAILIDEHGVVRKTRIRSGDIEKFVDQQFETPSTAYKPLDQNATDVSTLAARAEKENSVDSWVELGDAQLNWGKKASSTTDAVAAYKKAQSLKPSSYVAASIDFRLGVAYRRRHESPQRKPDDFDRAVRHWTDALEANPNQYIWRRRIQQYGPRQIKPYPFYDWVETAISEIKARGEKPVGLTVPLSGAEVAQPSRSFTSSHSDLKNPDPNDKLAIDVAGLIHVRSTVVPAIVDPGQTVRVHLQFETGKGKWNNESDPMTVWIDAPDPDQISRAAFRIPNAGEANSTEVRRIEFEYKTAKDSKSAVKLAGFAVFNVCVDDDGTCQFLRKNFEIEIPVRN